MARLRQGINCKTVVVFCVYIDRIGPRQAECYRSGTAQHTFMPASEWVGNLEMEMRMALSGNGVASMLRMKQIIYRWGGVNTVGTM